MTANSLTAATFARLAGSYDAMRRQLVPCFDSLYGTALDLIDQVAGNRPLRVLDLGAGTGLLPALLLDRHPDATVHLIDLADGMLARARERFAGNPRVTFALADIATEPLGGPSGEPWDVVMSALAIHHLEDADKRGLFGRIRETLADGGLFVNAEQVLGPTPAIEARYDAVWHDQIVANGVTADEMVRVAERMAHDRCATVEDQLTWLRAAGFTDVDCSFKSWRFAVLSGRR